MMVQDSLQNSSINLFLYLLILVCLLPIYKNIYKYKNYFDAFWISSIYTNKSTVLLSVIIFCLSVSYKQRWGVKSGFLDKGVSVTQPPMDQITLNFSCRGLLLVSIEFWSSQLNSNPQNFKPFSPFGPESRYPLVREPGLCSPPLKLPTVYW